jgi:hypothetical protein
VQAAATSSATTTGLGFKEAAYLALGYYALYWMIGGEHGYE